MNLKPLIYEVYNYDTHRSSDKEFSISATQLLGPLFKIKKILKGAKQDQSLIDNKFKRSSTIGTAFHERAEEALFVRDDIKQEIYMEREVIIDDIVYTISGSCDGIIKNPDTGNWVLFDWKSGYGKERKPEQLAKDAMQLSIYRWLFDGTIKIDDEGHILFISQSNNIEEDYTVQLRDEDWIQNWIEEVIWSALRTTRSDCNDGVRFNMCSYCMLICEERKS